MDTSPTNGDSKGSSSIQIVHQANPLSADGHSSRRHDYSSSRSSRDDYRSSRNDDRYDSSRHRDRDRVSDRSDRDRKRDSEDSSHHRSSHRHRDYSSRGDSASSRGSYTSPGEYTSSRGEYSSSRGDYSSSRGGGSEYPSSRDSSSRYDNRRGGGFGGGQSQRQERKRSASPRGHRGSTPDLTGVISIKERKRRSTMWDIKPAGYENVTAEQAKMSGMTPLQANSGLFPLPGTPREPQTQAGLLLLTQGNAPSNGPATGFIPPPLDIPKLSALNATHSRQGRRLVVSRLPPTSTEAEIHNMFNLLISGLNVYKEGSGEPVKDVKKATSGGIAMVEFADGTYATTTLALAGEIEMNGRQLEIRRASGYIVQPPEENERLSSETVSKEVPDSTQKLLIKGLPVYLTSDQGLELVEAFGAVCSWILVSETGASESKVALRLTNLRELRSHNSKIQRQHPSP
jgi:splicing factor U2AF 65 kDa subunit